MRHFESDPEPTTPELIEGVRTKLELSELDNSQLSRELAERSLSDMNPIDAAYAREAVDRLARLDRLEQLMGLVAPAGTAPRTALEQICIQSETSADESPIVLDLRHMLSQHWDEWTPALRQAEGLPPEPSE